MLPSKKCFGRLFYFFLIGLAAADQGDTVFRWSSTGGGWRSMIACAGFANVFHRAGLLTEDASLFSAIVSTLEIILQMNTGTREASFPN